MHYDVFGICFALLDLQAEVTDEQIALAGVAKGSMTLVTPEQQRTILDRLDQERVTTAAGGSGANTMSAIAILGGASCFTSVVGPDVEGEAYRRSLEERGVHANLGIAQTPTGTSLIQVTPDAQRTMCTALGAGAELTEEGIVDADLRASAYLYVTGYLWDGPTTRAAVEHAIAIAADAGVRVVLSLADPFCVGRHLEEFRALVAAGADVVMGNEDELNALTGASSAAEALELLPDSVTIAVVTLGADGCLVASPSGVVHVAAQPVQAVDTTGAGDTFAAGFLFGLTHGMTPADAASLGVDAAALVVTRTGPRLEPGDRAALVAAHGLGG